MAKALLPIGIILLLFGAIFTIEGAMAMGWQLPTPTPTPTPTATPTPTPTPTTFDITIKTVDQSGNALQGEIFVGGSSIGKGSVVFTATVGKVYKVTFGSLTGYTTPDGVTFSLGPEGKLADGTRTIKGIYAKKEPAVNEVKLTVEVRQATGVPGYTFPLSSVTVKVLPLNKEGKTDSSGLVTFMIPINYGSITVTTTDTGGHVMSRAVTIGAVDIKITMTYPAATLSLFGQLFGLQLDASMELLIGIVLLVFGMCSTYSGAKAFGQH